MEQGYGFTLPALLGLRTLVAAVGVSQRLLIIAGVVMKV